MAIVKYRPMSAGRRNSSVSKNQDLSKDKPQKKLVKGKSCKAGRGSRGRINVRFRGGGHKRRLRTVDFRRDKVDLGATVKGIEYDPNRSAHLALIQYVDGVKAYILAPAGIKVGDKVSAGDKAEINVGNHLPLNKLPLGSEIHNIELKKGKGGQMVRSAGTSAQLLARENSYATLRMPSGEIRLVHEECSATLGQVSNAEHELVKIGKAGRKRWLGRKPHQRGVSMNPVDHPLGGGEGRTSGGRHPVSPWGQPTKGYRTRKNKRTQSFIVRRRKK